MAAVVSVFFLDLEASSLHRGSHPIQVGWCDADGLGEEHLIRPEASWNDWSYESEAVHRISHGDLAINGRPAAEVAHRVVEVLGGHEVYCDAPAYDGAWLRKLLTVGGFRPERVPLRDVNELYGIACRPLFAKLPHPHHRLYSPTVAALQLRAREIVMDAQAAEDARQPRRHRALADAQALRRVWLAVRERVADGTDV